ncbi:MAG TPA: ATP-binding cassette domain-containing protein, partial [Massilibacterium sp.]|nr:ATP-binding cassette domain-containing protein [Massilibacterium sp.]
MTLLQLEKVDKRYNQEKKVLNEVSFTIEAGKFVSIIGPSGAGKSTLLRCINRMVDITEGTITFQQKNVMKLSKKEL